MSEFRIASWTRRFFAYLIDNIVIELMLVVLFVVLGIFLPSGFVSYPGIFEPPEPVGNLLTVGAVSSTVEFGWAYLAVFPFRFLYWMYYEYKFGKTVGKRMLQIKTVKEDGTKLSLVDAVVLTIFKTTVIPGDVLLGIIFVRKKKQRVANKLTNTIVISE